MIIHATRESIQAALDKANESFEGNLTFNNFQRLSDTRHRVTLRVKDSKEEGARVSFRPDDTCRRLVSACWHAHGTFFDALPEGTKIQTAGMVTYPGSPWVDRNIGSDWYPVYHSEACYCRS